MKRLHTTDLINLAHGMTVPVEVGLESDQAPQQAATSLVLEQLLRLLPGKRLVALTRWGDALAVAKLFFQPHHWQRHLERELAGSELLEQAGLPVPARLFRGTLEDGQGGVLLYEFLAGETLAAHLTPASVPTDSQLSTVLQQIARCHDQGLWQSDIHAGNFILQDGHCFLLDPAAMRAQSPGVPLSRDPRLDNLALFFAQLPAPCDVHLGAWLKLYQQLMVSPVELEEASAFVRRVRQARQTRLDNYQSKLFRSTSDLRRDHTPDRLSVARREILSRESEAFEYSPDEFVARGTMIKDGNTTTVVLISLDGRQYLVKRYNIKSVLHGLKRMLTPSRASKSWRSGLMLEMLGVATARPVLMLERRILWLLKRESYILCEYIEGPTVAQLLAQEADDAAVAAVFKGFRALFHIMRQYRISHGDMKATNFIMTPSGLVVVDLDAMIWHRSEAGFVAAFGKDLERFRRNFAAGTGLEQYADEASRLSGAFSG